MGNAELKLTRAVRRQIYTADLVFCTAVTFELSNEKPPKKTIDVLNRIKTRLENINHILYGGTRDQFLKRVSDKDRKRYLETIGRIRELMNEVLKDDHVEPDFFNAVLMVVENTRESVKMSKNKNLQKQWTMLNRSLATFCNHIIDEPAEYDPEWIGYKYEPLGVAMGERFHNVMMS